MKLSTVHQVFVMGTIVLCAILVVRGGYLFATGGAAVELMLPAVAAVVAVLARNYLRRFRERLSAAGGAEASHKRSAATDQNRDDNG